MKKYHFTLGHDTEETRIYGGTLLTPMRGFKLGLKVAKLVSEIIGKLEIDFSLEELISESAFDNKEALSKLLKLLCDGFKYFDDDEYMELVEEVVTKSSIYAKVDGEKDVSLNNINDLNKWFERFPQDFLIFTAHILWQNASPFLPRDLLEINNEKNSKDSTKSLLN